MLIVTKVRVRVNNWKWRQAFGEGGVKALAEAAARAKTTAAVAAEAMVSESTLASSSRWRSVSGRVRGAIRFKNAAQTPLEAVVGAGAMAAEAVVGAGATVLEAVSLPFKDRKHPPALSIDIEP